MDARNIKQVLIAANCTRTANVQITDPNATTTYLGLGEVVVVGPNGVVLTTTTAVKAVEFIQIVQRSRDGKSIYKSAPIYGKYATRLATKVYAAATEKLVYLGSNGTTGTITSDLAADTSYWLKLVPRMHESMIAQQPKTFSYKSGSTAPTQVEVANGIVRGMNYDLKGDTNYNVVAEALIDEAGTAITGTGTLTIANGDVTLKAGTAIDAVLTVGDYIRFDASVGAAPAVTDGIYKIMSIDATTETAVLDKPYTGTSLSAAAEGNGVYFTAVTAAAAEAGIKISGQAYDYVKGKFSYVKSDFDVQVSTTITASPVTATKASKGTGSYEETTDLEYRNKAYNSGIPRVDGSIPTSFPQDTLSTETYDYITIGWEYNDNGDLADNIHHQGDIVLAVAVGAGQGDGGTTTIEEVLNKYLVTENGVGTAIVLT